MTVSLIVGSGTSTRSRVIELIANLINIKSKAAGPLDLDFSQIEWVTPLAVVPIATVLNALGSYRIVKNTNNKVKSYLNTICFPIGTTMSTMRGTSSYLPVVKIPINNSFDATIGKYLSELLVNFFQENVFGKNVVGYFLTEMAANVREHSQAHSIWLMSQFWEKTDQCEICLVDSGVGFRGAYQAANMNTADDREAVQNALRGISSKGVERGFGVSTNIRMFTEDPVLKGEFLLISGNIGYYKKWGKNPFFFSLNNFTWLGSIIMVKFNRPHQEVDIYEYVE